MKKTLVRHARRFLHEVRLILKRGRRIWPLVPGEQKRALAGAGLVMGTTSAANTGLALLLGKLVSVVQQGVEQGTPRETVYRAVGVYLGIVGGIYLSRELLHVFRRFLVENTCTRINRSMNVKLLAHMMKVDLARLSHDKIGALHGRIVRSVDGLVRFLRLSFLDFFPVLLSGLFALTATILKQPCLGLVMMGVIPISLGLTIWQLISQKGVRLRLMRSCEVMDGTIVEQLSGLEYVRAANTHRQEIKRVAKTAEKRRRMEIRHHFQMSLFGCAKALNEGFFHILVIGFAVCLAVRGTIGIGDILTFSMLFLNVMGPLSDVHRLIDEGHESSLQVGNLLKLLAEPIDRSFRLKASREPCLEQTIPLLVIKNLRVEYLTAEGERRRGLDGISLTLDHGETVGVAGRTGCGKTTWLKVLTRLVHPTDGTVMVGGVPLEAVSREAIGRLVGYVGQSPFIFSGTIAQNIAYGSGSVSPAEIQRAAEMACIHDEILAMPRVYQARVIERGHNLSGGQRQRIALARLFLQDPPIMILDEGTSALDNITERHVQRALAAARANRTVILVAHRLSTLRDADRIIVFEAGRIVEIGTYQDLIARGGAFTELVRSAETSQGIAGTLQVSA